VTECGRCICDEKVITDAPQCQCLLRRNSGRLRIPVSWEQKRGRCLAAENGIFFLIGTTRPRDPDLPLRIEHSSSCSCVPLPGNCIGVHAVPSWSVVRVVRDQWFVVRRSRR
jgi:hypothetical protein